MALRTNPVFASWGAFAWAVGCIGIVLGEVVVLVVNRMRYLPTPLAARCTADRSPKFDIYLPQWLARSNQHLFCGLYLVGIVYVLALWLWEH